MTLFSRWIAVALAAMLVSPAMAADTLRVGKAGATAFPFVPVDVGQRVGFFEKRGIALEIASFGGDAKVQQAMVADSLDIGLGSGPGLAFIAKGSPVKGIAAMADPPLTFALVVRNDDSIKSVDDLKGRKIGISSVGSVTSWIVGEVGRQKGWGYDGMTPVAIGEDPARVAAVKAQAIDAAIVNLTIALKYMQSGDGRILLRFGDLLRDFHVHVIFAADKTIAEKPAVLKSFLAGWFDTVAYMRNNKSRTVEIAKDVMGTDAQTAGFVYDEMMPMLNDDGHFKPKAMSVLARSFVDMKTLPAEPDMKKLIDESFLPRK